MHQVTELTAEERRRYARQFALPAIGERGQLRLKGASVLVIGAGGLGSPILLALGAAGVGRIGIVDFDAVELSNLHRQTMHRTADIGRAKTESAADAVRAVNPLVTVVEYPATLAAENVAALCRGYDVIVDGTDDADTHYLAAAEAERLGVPYVWGSALGTDGMFSVFWPNADPARNPRYLDLFPDPSAVDPASCATVGVLGPLCGTVGSLMAAEVVKLLTGSGTPMIGRVLVIDALDASMRELPLRPRPEPVPVRAPSAPTEISPEELAALIASDAPPVLIDVREPEEHAAGALPGSLLRPLGTLGDPATIAALPEGDLVLYCAIGKRSAYACLMLAESGREARSLAGGYRAWTATLPTA